MQPVRHRCYYEPFDTALPHFVVVLSVLEIFSTPLRKLESKPCLVTEKSCPNVGLLISIMLVPSTLLLIHQITFIYNVVPMFIFTFWCSHSIKINLSIKLTHAEL